VFTDSLIDLLNSYPEDGRSGVLTALLDGSKMGSKVVAERVKGTGNISLYISVA